MCANIELDKNPQYPKIRAQQKESMLITNRTLCKIVETIEKLCLGVAIIKNRRPVMRSIGTGSQASFTANQSKNPVIKVVEKQNLTLRYIHIMNFCIFLKKCMFADLSDIRF